MHLNARALGIQGSNQAHENDGADHAAQPAFHRLSGTDSGRQLMGAHRSADEIRPHVIGRAAQRDKDQNGKPLRPPPNFHRAVEEYGKQDRLPALASVDCQRAVNRSRSESVFL